LIRKPWLQNFLLVFLGLVLVFSSGCSKPKEVTLRGWVYLNGPISGATLAVYDVKGKQLYQSKQPATSEQGSFQITLPKLPGNFRINASGGSLRGQDFPSPLSADYREFSPQMGVVYINAVTTMISAYLDKNPGKTLNEATTAIKNYLAIPPWLDIGSSLEKPGTYFSHARFIAESNSKGGMTPYISQLVAEIDGKTGATHPFTGGNLMGTGGGQGPAGFVGSYVVDKLTAGALQWAGGKVLGWGLSQIGLSLDNGPTKQDIEEMKAQLNIISGKLDALSNQVNDVYNKLSTEIQQTEYNIRIGQMNDYLSSVNGTREMLEGFITAPPPAGSELIEKNRKIIANAIETNLLTKDSIIYNQLTGQNGQTPLLKVWANIVKSHHRFLTAEDYKAIKAQFDFFDLIQAYAMELQVEYWYYQGENATYHENIDKAIGRYNDYVKKESEMLVQSVPPGTFVDTQTGMMWMQKPIFNVKAIDYKTIMGPLDYIYGGDYLKRDLKLANPDSTLNHSPGLNYGYSNWIMPNLPDLQNLMDKSSGADATVWFINQGAFPDGTTADSLWTDKSRDTSSGGNVWTMDWYWQGSTSSEVVKMKNLVNGRETISEILTRGAAGIGSVLPCRLISPGEKYYWK